jgi:hypothetical protein
VGDSLPPAGPIDLIGSYARMSDLHVEIVLERPSLTGSKSVLVLTKDERSVQARVRVVQHAEGRRFVVRVPRRRLRAGIWSLTMRSERGGDEVVGARLLVQDERPLVLLWGPETYGSIVPAQRANTPKARAVNTAAHALDIVLAKLPAGRAHQIRDQVRAVARRILK